MKLNSANIQYSFLRALPLKSAYCFKTFKYQFIISVICFPTHLVFRIHPVFKMVSGLHLFLPHFLSYLISNQTTTFSQREILSKARYLPLGWYRYGLDRNSRFIIKRGYRFGFCTVLTYKKLCHLSFSP